MAASDMRTRLLLTVLAFAAVTAIAPRTWAQSAGEVERCFQNPGACSQSGSQPAPIAPAPSPAVTASRTAPAPDYTSVLQSAEPDRRKIQESLRTLDKYNGPIDGNLQSEATMKAISEWQKGHGYSQVGKLTPTEAQTLNAEAARAPIKRLDPTQTAKAAPTPLAPAPISNADALKALQDGITQRRKAAEPKANAGAQALIKDLKAYIAAEGKGIAGEQFTGFAKWYAENKAAGRSFGGVTPVIDDYGNGKSGAAETAEIRFETRQGDQSYSQCLMFAWVEGTPRRKTEAYSCDDVAAVEKWKTEQALKSAWR
jgi:hypothetical protein